MFNVAYLRIYVTEILRRKLYTFCTHTHQRKLDRECDVEWWHHRAIDAQCCLLKLEGYLEVQCSLLAYLCN